jgi:hypothetical protein
MKRATAVTLLCLIALATAFAQEQPKKEEAERPEVARQIIKYLRENFGEPGYETSWYRNIRGVSVRGDTVFTRTDLETADVSAKRICGAVSGFVFDRTRSSLSLNRVQVIGQGDKVLIDRNGVGELCR